MIRFCILKWLAKICDICPDMGVGYYAAVGHFATEYGIHVLKNIEIQKFHTNLIKKENGMEFTVK